MYKVGTTEAARSYREGTSRIKVTRNSKHVLSLTGSQRPPPRINIHGKITEQNGTGHRTDEYRRLAPSCTGRDYFPAGAPNISRFLRREASADFTLSLYYTESTIHTGYFAPEVLVIYLLISETGAFWCAAFGKRPGSEKRPPGANVCAPLKPFRNRGLAAQTTLYASGLVAYSPRWV